MLDHLAEFGSLFVSAFISSTIAPGGSEAVLAYWVNEMPEQVVLLVTVATIGNTLGAMTTWFLGVLAARKLPLEHLLAANKQKALAWVKRWGVWSLFLSWLPVVGDGLCFAGGWLKLPLFFSVLAILIGKALRYSALAYFFV